MRKRVLLDCDGVLSDFITPALRIVADLGGPILSHDEMDRWDIQDYVPEGLRSEFWRRVCAEGWCFDMKPYDGAVDAVRQMHDRGYDVRIVTSPMLTGKTWPWERQEWLSKHFDIQRNKIYSCADKTPIDGDMFVDDKPSHVHSWLAEHPMKTARVWDTPHNRMDELRLDRLLSWGHALKILDFCFAER